VLQVAVQREEEHPLKATFGGISLKRKKRVTRLTDKVVHLGHKRTELLQRLLAEKCEVCGSEENVEVHHVRKLADLNKPGRKQKPLWVKRMAELRRKTLIVCKECHNKIHYGSVGAHSVAL
jgi:hypothetical protein